MRPRARLLAKEGRSGGTCRVGIRRGGAGACEHGHCVRVDEGVCSVNTCTVRWHGPFVSSVLRDCEGVRAVEVVPAMVCCLCASREFDI